MKLLFKAVTMLIKMTLSIAGIVLLFNKLNDSGGTRNYDFTVDSAINRENRKSMKQSLKKKQNFNDLQESYFKAMDFKIS